MEQKLSYAGIAAAVSGVVGFLGVFSDWWATEAAVYHGTADVSGTLALAMSLGLFAFGGAYVLLADRGIRRAMGALMTLCAVVLTLACVWGLTRADEVAANATVESGMYVSLLGGLVGIAAGLLALRNAMQADAPGAEAPTDTR